MKQSFLVVFLILLAGCATPSDGDADHSDSKPTDPGRQPTTPDDPAVATPRESTDQLHLNDCKVFELGFRWPMDSNPSGPPSEWERNDGGLWTRTHYSLYQCERLGWQGFERAATILFEFDDNYADAFNCAPADNASLYILHRIYVDDESLASSFGETLHWPVMMASLDLDVESDAVATTVTTTWSPAGYPESTATYRETGSEDLGSSFIHRFVWDHATGVSAMDWTQQLHRNAGQTTKALVDMEDPFLVSGGEADTPVADASYGFNLRTTATITQYQDQKCDSPL